MSRVTRYVLVRVAPWMLLGVFTAACAGHLGVGRHSDPCDHSASVDSVPFDSAAAKSLAGHYRLTLVSDWEDERGRSVRGDLNLQPTDTLHQFYEQVFPRQWRRGGNRPLWGWAELRPKNMDIPWTADPASRDPEHPGVLLHSSGELELGVWRGLDGSSTTLSVKTTSMTGFGGTWDSDQGIAAVFKDGRRLPNPHGHFCALRQ